MSYDLAYHCARWGLVGALLFSVPGLLSIFISNGCLCNFATVGVISMATAAYFASTLKISSAGKGVLITGCDTGFGHHLALRLHSLGFTVFAGCLNPTGDGAEKLKQEGSGRIHVIGLDVTKDEQVKEAEKFVRGNLPQGGLWSVVNNAGIAVYADAEWVSMKNYYSVMEVNFMGLVRTTKAFLPLIRKSKGRVVNVASVFGMCTGPGIGIYSASKHAVKAFSDALRYEMKYRGVNVCTVEPGNFVTATSLLPKERLEAQKEALWDEQSQEVKAAYGRHYFDARMESFNKLVSDGNADPTSVVDALTNAIVDAYPRARYQPTTPDFHYLTLVQNYLPDWVVWRLGIDSIAL